MRWVLLSALAWVAVITIFAITMETPAHPPHLSPSAAASDLARELSVVGTSGRLEPSWIVTRAEGFGHELVVNVQAEHPDQARRIAGEIVEPIREKYEEVLIYVRPSGAPAWARVYRVQWTRRGGFVESGF